VRATTSEEGLLGIALAPDFAVSKLLYAYLTTTDEDQNQHVRVYRENASGAGEYVGTVQSTLEPPTESSARNGGHVTFGVDGCLYVGVGDNGSNNRWNAQLLLGTDPLQSSENSALCTNVCLGPSVYPARTITNDGALNQAGKVLRLAVAGASPAQPGPGGPLASQPYVFGAGLRNPSGLAVHPLTGQLYVTERGDTQETEIDVVDRGSDLGWPCLEGSVVSAGGVASCLAGRTPADVYGNHPDWRRPLATHVMSPTITGITAYTGLGYPAAYYGDVFYLLRASARIYRIDLDAPCFLPHPNGVTPMAFHDSTDDGDFTVVFDIDGDGQQDQVSFTNLVAIAQAPNPLGQQVLYVAAKQGTSNALDEDSVIFRIEYATAFTPYSGTPGRVPDACFSDGVYSGGGVGAPLYGYENPFLRETCLPPGGPCPGQPDGTPCDDGDPCNGAETCHAGVCQHGAPAPDGTTCGAGATCRADGSCQAGRCTLGPALADGTACSVGDPCFPGLCAAGACQPGGAPPALRVRQLKVDRERRGPGSGALVLSGWFQSARPIAPESSDAVRVELRHGAEVMFSAAVDHPASDPFWKRRKRLVQYKNRRNPLGSIVLWMEQSGVVRFDIRGRRLAFTGLDDPAVSSRLVIGPQCFVADLTGACTLDAKKLRCRPGGR
jgi:glucose/arabinose dehydrogenase